MFTIIDRSVGGCLGWEIRREKNEVGKYASSFPVQHGMAGCSSVHEVYWEDQKNSIEKGHGPNQGNISFILPNKKLSIRRNNLYFAKLI